MIEDILLEVWGTPDRKPTEFQQHTAFTTARRVEETMTGVSPRKHVKATLRAAYFDINGTKSEIATQRIFNGE